jgi:hypothetical protein
MRVESLKTVLYVNWLYKYDIDWIFVLILKQLKYW